ncbi:MAG: methionyl-tRNA formyltransferase [bacterium]|nr:methionyl-tRNA formyltransferase [bacterium]
MLDKKLKNNFVFFGTPDVASETLEILKQSGFLPSLIITAPDRPAGRKLLLTPPPVKTWATKNNIPYIQPEKITPSALLDTSPLLSGRENTNTPDLFVVVAYGKILPESIINMPRLGTINIHYSLLPKYRGASPVESAVLNGDTETGVCIQKMAFKMDTGDIIMSEKILIEPTETAPKLRTRLIKIGGDLLVKTLPDIFLNKIILTPQDETLATHCKKICKEDGLIDLATSDLATRSPSGFYNKFRAYYHWPRIYFMHDDKRVIITDAMLEDDKFIIKKVIPEGRKEITWEEFQKNY